MKKLAILMLTLVMAFGFGTAASAAMSIEIDFYGGTTGLSRGDWDTGGAVKLDYTMNEWVMVDIVAADVPVDGVAIFSWILNFNAATMQVSGLDTDFGFVFVDDIDNTAGTVSLEAASTSPESGDVVLGTFRIDCTGIGIDQLLIALLNDNNNLLGSPSEADFSALYDGVTATVNQVPIPGAVWLLGSGLFGLVAIRRKKKS